MRALLSALVLGALARPLVAEPNDMTRLKMLIGGRTLRVTRDEREAWAYQWPAVYFAARFQGDKVTFAFDDPNNNFNVLIDGQTVSLLKKPGTGIFEFRDLGSGDHTIRVEKRSETPDSVGAFKGFFVPKKANALPAAAAPRAIEFIGDSLTVGSGNTSTVTKCTPEEIFATTDAQQGFGPLVAKHFAANYQVNALSGLGMVRNGQGREQPKDRLEMLYPRALFDDPTPDDSPWHPQIIVIGIGGADSPPRCARTSRGGTKEEFAAYYEKTYVAFMKELRAKNPRAAPPHDLDERPGRRLSGSRPASPGKAPRRRDQTGRPNGLPETRADRLRRSPEPARRRPHRRNARGLHRRPPRSLEMEVDSGNGLQLIPCRARWRSLAADDNGPLPVNFWR